MRHFFMLAAGMAAGLLAAGCFEGKAEYTFNPDGTGKVVGEITFSMEGPFAPPKAVGDDLRTFDDEMKLVVTGILKKSIGVDAWKDVSFEKSPGDRVHFKGTAYFKEASKVKFFPDVRPRVGCSSDGPDAMMLILLKGDTSETTTGALKLTPRALSTAELTAAIKTERDTYKKWKLSVETPYRGLKYTLLFNTPGTPGELHNMTSDGKALSAGLDGSGIIAMLDAYVADNAKMKELILSGGNLNAKALNEEVRGKLYGPKGETWAQLAGPFKAEMEAAKKAMPDMMVRLGLDAPKTTTPTTPPKGGTTTTTRTGGTTTPSKSGGGSTTPAVPKMPMPISPVDIPTPILPF
jgi:hypothetical protein